MILIPFQDRERERVCRDKHLQFGFIISIHMIGTSIDPWLTSICNLSLDTHQFMFRNCNRIHLL